MKYSYHCRFCGFTAFANDKQQIRREREDHNPIDKAFRTRRPCTMIPLKDGSFMRPDLLEILEERDGMELAA